MKYIFTFLLIGLLSLATKAQQITGSSSVALNGTKTYEYSAGHITLGTWTAIGGTVLSSGSTDGDTNYATIKWTIPGNGKVKFGNPFNGSNYDTHNVNVTFHEGEIGGSATICQDGNALITNISDASPGSLSFQYKWKMMKVLEQSFYDAPGNNDDPEYNASNIDRKTFFKREVYHSGNKIGESNEISIDVISDVMTLPSGSISNSHHGNSLCPGSATGTISGTVPSGNIPDEFEYDWRKKTGNTWGPWESRNTKNYPSVNIGNQDLKFQRKVMACGRSVTSNVISINAFNTANPGSILFLGIEGSSSICNSGDTYIFNTNDATSDFEITGYEWWRKRESDSEFIKINSQTSATYSASTPNGTTLYKRRPVVSNNCGQSVPFSNVVSITKLPSFSTGTIIAPTAVCSDETFTISHGDDPTGAVSYNYEWVAAEPSQTFEPIGGNTQDLTVSGGISTRTTYRRYTNSTCGSHYDQVVVDITTPLLPGSVSSPEDGIGNLYCVGIDPTTITNSSSASGGDYQWQKSEDFGSTWHDISNADNSSYNPPKIYKATWYRRQASNGLCNPVNSNVIKLSAVIDPVTEAATISGSFPDAYESGLVNLTYSSSEDTHWEYNDGNGWHDHPAGTNTSLNETITNDRQYRASSQNDCGGPVKTDPILVSVLNKEEVINNVALVVGNGSAVVDIVGYTGTIDKWQKRNAGVTGWTNIPGSSNTYSQTFSGLTKNLEFRILVNGDESDVFTIQHILDAQDMIVVGPDRSTSTTVNLSIENSIGTPTTWQVSINGNVASILNTASNNLTFDNTASTIFGDNLYFRAVFDINGNEYYTDWKHVDFINLNELDFRESQHTTITPRHEVTDVNSLSTSNAVFTHIYADGLGRTVQSVVKNQTPNQKDYISFIEYDEYGMSPKSYMPFSSTNSTDYYVDPIAKQRDFYTTQPNIAHDTAAYSFSEYEASPRNRVLKSYGVGSDWHAEEKYVKQAIYFNEASTVRKWQGDGTSNTFYAANELVKATTVDENGHSVITYTDHRGLTILKEVEAESGVWLKTYHVYDELGKLKHTIPPKAVEWMISSNNYTVSNTAVNELVFSYTYDDLGRLVEKKIPGKEVEYIVYDPFDRPVLTQDGNLRANNQWYFSKLDNQGRVVYGGIYTNTTATTRAAVQALFDGLNFEGSDDYFEIIDNSTAYKGYTNRVFPTANIELLYANYYDDYDFDNNGVQEFEYEPNHLEGLPTDTYEFSRLLPTGSTQRIVGTATWLMSAIFYDEYGRTVQTMSENHLGTVNVESVIYTPITGEVSKTKSSVHEVETIQEYDYDHAGRLTKLYHTAGKRVNWENLTHLAETGNGIVKQSGGNSWNAGASTLQYIDADQNGSIEFIANSTTKHRMIGLSSVNTNQSWEEIDYKFHLRNSGTAFIREGNSNSLENTINYEIGDHFKIERINGVVKYYHNGVELRSVVDSDNSLLTPDISVHTANHVLEPITLTINPRNTLAQYTYNELGQVIKKELHEKAPNEYLQTNDFDYNIRGWLKSINDPANLSDQQLFGMNLHYNDDMAGMSGHEKSYNGNISGIEWKSNVSSNSTIQGYAYDYDHADRLKKADYGSGSNFTDKAQHHALTSINYDANGNVEQLERNMPNALGVAIIADDLDYTYEGNAIKAVNDQVTEDFGFDNGSNQAEEYTYDSNGNMVSDSNKGISSISYNVLNKPDTINFDDGANIIYTYSAAGNKLSQVMNYFIVNEIDYMRDDAEMESFWIENDVTSSDSQDAGGELDVLRIRTNSDDSDHSIYHNYALAGTNTVKVEFSVYIPSNNNTADGAVVDIGGSLGNIVSTANQWITVSHTASITDNATIKLFMTANGALTFDDYGEIIYVKDFKISTVNSASKKTDFIAGAVYEDEELQFFSQPEGRIIANADGSLEYQYAYTDHLGNVRMIYTSDQDTINFKATFESQEVEQIDDTLFQGIDNDNSVHTQATSHDEVLRLNSGNIGGAGISIPVYPGDSIDMSVQGFYDGSSTSDDIDLNGLVDAVAAIFGGVSGGNFTEQSTYDMFNNSITTLNHGSTNYNNNTDFPAYLNYIIFDKNFNKSVSGFVPMDDDADNIPMEMALSITSEVEGFIYVYLTNESREDVYFDDFEVKVRESMIVQNTDYYPFGLQHSTSWTRITDMKNNFLYNAGSELNEQTKNYETFYRHYDPALGRMTAIDPVAAKYSSHTPYNYAFNDPIALNDPMGDDPHNERRREFTGDTWAMQEAYYRDENPHFQMVSWYGGDRQGFRISNHANSSGYDPGARMNNWASGFNDAFFNASAEVSIHDHDVCSLYPNRQRRGNLDRSVPQPCMG